MSVISLNCWILGTDPTRNFTVQISSTAIVCDLNKPIKQENSVFLHDIDSSDLAIWKLSSPIRSGDLVKLLEHVKTPQEIEDCNKLDPLDSLSVHFPSPPLGHLHVVVERLTGKQNEFILLALRSLITFILLLQYLVDPQHRSNHLRLEGCILPYENFVLTNATAENKLHSYSMTGCGQMTKRPWSDITETVEESIPSLDDDDDHRPDVDGAAVPDITMREPHDHGLDGDCTSVPEISMREPKTLTKATFVDLRTMLSLGEFDEPELLEPRFLVREEYSELYEYLDRGSPLSKHVLLVGQPGIGKTMFLTYCLLKRLIDRRPTIFAPSAGIRFMFLDTGVYFIPHDFYDYDDPLVDTQYEDSLVLQDLNESQLKPQQFKDWRVLVASPPELDRYKAWGKYKQPKYFAMKTWTWDEIFLARGMGVRSRSDDEWRIAYLKYGGSARLLYTGDVYAERQISLAITECNDIRTLFPLISLGFKNHTSHALIQMNPKVEKDMKVNREIMSGQITSGYILEKLLERNMQELVNTMADTFHMLFSNDVTRSASRILFEGAGHRHLLASCTVPFYIRPLSGQSGPVQLNLQHVQGTRSFTPQGIRPFQELDPKYYYRPLINNFAGIDSFALEVDHSHLPVSVVLFQFATSLNHPVKTNFFQKLWNKHQLTSNMWKLVFIVPQAMQAKYVAQPLKPTTAAKDWGDRVEQYVLGVDTYKIWDALRQDSIFY